MIRFALLLFMSLAVSSQATAAVKWNNPSQKKQNDFVYHFAAPADLNSLYIKTRETLITYFKGTINITQALKSFQIYRKKFQKIAILFQEIFLLIGNIFIFTKNLEK